MAAIAVTLTWAEFLQAGFVGVMRNVQNMKDGRKHRHGLKEEDAWRAHIEGAAGEVAAAKGLGVYWPGVGVLRGADVGQRLQVRRGRRLCIHPDDPDDAVFIHVDGFAPRFVLRGWMFAREAKRQEWWEDPQHEERWAYFVPVDQTRDMATLRLEGRDDDRGVGPVDPDPARGGRPDAPLH